MIIAITGTPGVGTTKFAKELSKKLKNATVIEINEIVNRYRLFSKRDRFGSKIVKIRELNKAIERKVESTNKNLIIVGHLVPDLSIKMDITVVLRAKLKEIIKRLEERGYQREKIRENVLAEALDYCGINSQKTSKEIYEVESKMDKSIILEYLNKKSRGLKQKAPKNVSINKMGELLALLKKGNVYNL